MIGIWEGDIIKIKCDCESENVEVFSVEERTINSYDKTTELAVITYICKDCGKTEEQVHYLYKMDNTPRKTVSVKGKVRLKK